MNPSIIALFVLAEAQRFQSGVSNEEANRSRLIFIGGQVLGLVLGVVVGFVL